MEYYFNLGRFSHPSQHEFENFLTADGLSASLSVLRPSRIEINPVVIPRMDIVDELPGCRKKHSAW